MKISRTPFLALAVSGAVFLAVLLGTFHELPVRVASHFGGGGTANDWMDREHFIIFMALVGFGLPAIIMGLSFAGRFLPRELINLPRKDYWLASERAGSTYDWIFESSQWMGAAAFLFMAALHWLAVQANRQSPPRLSPLIWVVAAAFICAAIVWSFALLRHFSTPRPPSVNRGYGVVLLIILAVLVPSACLVWFMNRAVQNERFAVREKLIDAYRGNVTLIQAQLQSWLHEVATSLESDAKRLPAALLFKTEVEKGIADSVIVLTSSNTIAYPTGQNAAEYDPALQDRSGRWFQASQMEATGPAEAAAAFGKLAGGATNANFEALCLLAEARCLARAGATNKAIAVLTGPLADLRFVSAVDPQGRLVQPNAELLAIELGGGAQASANDALAATINRLKARLDDYSASGLSSPQRRFLIAELRRLVPGREERPLLEAEELAARVLESQFSDSPTMTLRRSDAHDVWEYPCGNAHAVLLFTTKHLAVRLRDSLPSASIPADMTLSVLPPGARATNAFLLTDAGAELPGWQLAASMKTAGFSDTATEQRITAYVWTGMLVLASVFVLALVVLWLVRRQLAVNRLRTDLVANVTHELKTPLASIRLLVDTLLGAPTTDPKTQREYLELIASENLRLSRLIENFLAFSRLERNKYNFNYKPTAPADVVSAAAAAMRERFNGVRCALTASAEKNLPLVNADKDALVTAMINLLDNAWKYTGEEKKISISANRQNGSVAFSVRDNGIGLQKRETKRIFRRFYQVDQRMTRDAGGCGIGLSIVKYIVTAHEGDVMVESKPGVGSTFTLLIPANPRSGGTVKP
jgi:signal transduction histidine kinase